MSQVTSITGEGLLGRVGVMDGAKVGRGCGRELDARMSE